MLDKTDLDNRLWQNYKNHYDKIDELDYSGERPYLSCEDILDAHYLICEHFRKLGEGIGGFGPKDFGLLTSAAGRQLASAGGSFIYNDFWEISATLMIGLIVPSRMIT
ncbi:hypothetical protein [Rhodobacteraceae bacterium W635]|uniref:hypothetical protein n=1 Tax=Nioella halotolerans TaxID=2303578 RepID=UPI0011C0FFB6